MPEKSCNFAFKSGANIAKGMTPGTLKTRTRLAVRELRTAFDLK
jgi:hypothetical protein